MQWLFGFYRACSLDNYFLPSDAPECIFKDPVKIVAKENEAVKLQCQVKTSQSGDVKFTWTTGEEMEADAVSMFSEKNNYWEKLN